MLLNPDEYEQARQARDPHFDGRFFVGVLTTGIYCRPVCPVRIPKKENIRLYSSAAAAAEAGFRPCLRCRPESSPGTPAWMGTSHTVSRALQLIANGALNNGSVQDLALQVGVSARQLTRLFDKHLGVSPLTVANTQRLHLAKKLIDETTLSMTEICFAAGFSSVRRFNAVFRQVYDRSPMSLRKNTVAGAVPAPNQGIRIRLSFRPPFDWRTMLAYLARRAIPGVEHVTDSTYSRTIMPDGKAGELSVCFSDNSNTLLLTIHHEHTRFLYQIAERVRIMFDLKAVSTEIENFLSNDPFLRPVVAANPGIRVPVAWDGFEVAVRAIIGQQVSVKGATTLVSRFAAACGTPYQSAINPALNLIFPLPQAVLEAPLSGLGLTTRRIDAIKQLAAAVCAGELHFDGSMATAQFVERITRISGIGPWTAQYIALRALNDPDAFPHSDLILLRAAAADDETLTPGQLLAKAERWRPWRAYVVMLLWRHYATASALD